MNIKVLYHSMTGNTKKIAEAIAGQAGVSAEPITADTSLQNVDLLFIGDGIYGGGASSVTQGLIKSLSKDTVKNAAVFGTYGGQKKAIVQIVSALKDSGVNVCGDTFGCKGRSWMLFNAVHPDDDDIRKAKLFAKDIIEKCGK